MRETYCQLWGAWRHAPAGARAELAEALCAVQGKLAAQPGPVAVRLGCGTRGAAEVRAAMLRAGGIVPHFADNVSLIVWVAHPADVTLALYGRGALSPARVAVLCAQHGVPYAATFGCVYPGDADRMERWARKYARTRAAHRAVRGYVAQS